MKAVVAFTADEQLVIRLAANHVWNILAPLLLTDGREHPREEVIAEVCAGTRLADYVRAAGALRRDPGAEDLARRVTEAGDAILDVVGGAFPYSRYGKDH